MSGKGSERLGWPVLAWVVLFCSPLALVNSYLFLFSAPDRAESSYRVHSELLVQPNGYLLLTRTRTARLQAWHLAVFCRAKTQSTCYGFLMGFTIRAKTIYRTRLLLRERSLDGRRNEVGCLPGVVPVKRKINLERILARVNGGTKTPPLV